MTADSWFDYVTQQGLYATIALVIVAFLAVWDGVRVLALILLSFSLCCSIVTLVSQVSYSGAQWKERKEASSHGSQP